jgi:hypothetical protein
LAASSFTLLAGSSCDGPGEPSKNVETSEMTANFVATTTGVEKMRVRATLTIPGMGILADRVSLTGGDRLIATNIDASMQTETEKTLQKNGGLFGPRYQSQFRTQDKDTRIEIVLDRSKSGKANAGISSTTLPTPFELDWVADPIAKTPAPNKFSRSSATPYYVVWEPFDAPDFEPGDDFRFSITGSCIMADSGNIDWQGGVDALRLTGVLQDNPDKPGRSCDLHVELSLSRDGTVDGAYAGGTFVGEQVRVMKLQSVP